ncbi:MAG TPA: iron-sulfur cluster assembly accessory protein [Rhodocyclaceae bacterium]
MCVTLSESAERFMKRILRFSGAPPGSGFRLVVRSGGCSGFDSQFSVEPEPLDGDAVVDQNGWRLFLEAETCALLRGATIEFAESRIDGGLRYSLPGGAASCGCSSGSGASKSTTVGIQFMRRPGTCSKPSGASGRG